MSGKNNILEMPLLEQGKAEILKSVLTILSENAEIISVMLGGSMSFNHADDRSDADLFCLVRNVRKFTSCLPAEFEKVSSLDIVVYQGRFPWTEELYTMYFSYQTNFSIDLCLVDLQGADSFFWEPNGMILFDEQNTLSKIRCSQFENQLFENNPFNKTNPFTLSIVTLKKIGKNLERNHLWNAIELLNIMRRYFMQIIRGANPGTKNYLGRPDRDIEEVINTKDIVLLAETLPDYNRSDIARKTMALCDLFLKHQNLIATSEESKLSDWIVKNFHNEYAHLSKYLKHA